METPIFLKKQQNNSKYKDAGLWQIKKNAFSISNARINIYTICAYGNNIIYAHASTILFRIFFYG